MESQVYSLCSQNRCFFIPYTKFNGQDGCALFKLDQLGQAGVALRKMIHGMDVKVEVLGGKKKPFVYFDNAASTPPLKPVLDELRDFMCWYSGVHRGTGYKSLLSSRIYDHCHDVIAEFVKADPTYDSVILVKNTTEAINKLSYRLGLKPGDMVITTAMEHHSNDLPWRARARVAYIDVDSNGCLDMGHYADLLKKHYPRVKLVAVCGASNVTGAINDVHTMAEMAHSFGARLLVDGAQLIPHQPFDIKSHRDPRHIDYLAFSGHKIFAPFGCGVLIGPRDVFRDGMPEYSGGGTVHMVLRDHVYWGELPDKEEAGSPNVPGAFALARTLTYLQNIGMDRLSTHEQQMTGYLIGKLRQNREVVLYGSEPRVGVVSFNIKGLSHALVGAALCFEEGVGTRTGCFCAQGYVRHLLGEGEEPGNLAMYRQKLAYRLPGMVRISLAAYNTRQELDRVIQLVERITARRAEYRQDYQWIGQLGTFAPRDLPITEILEKHYRHLWPA